MKIELTPEIEDKLLNPRPGSKVEAAQKFGIDLTLNVENLKLTPTQRVMKLQQAALTFAKIRQAKITFPKK